MFKKMFKSFIIMFFISLIGLLLIQYVSDSMEESEEKKDEIIFTFEDKDYIYFLKDDQIEQMIRMGISSLHTIDNFLLPAQQNSQLFDEILFAYIDPPTLKVMNLARQTFHQYHRIIHITEAKAVLSDQYLPFVVRFHGGNRQLYDIQLEQNETFFSAEVIEILGTGEGIRAYFPTEMLDFSISAVLHVTDSDDPENIITFEVEFEKYVLP
ncbi:hypothetical protein [Evansella tamaricis]|uniref:Uncharacterized protein n=1 Tax=Evansella tamaricis TaxID=2069301 RepID=A0ABS6JLQ6_9BACI|nr:hypothetical protein [Evansella tamaricis]MBU9713782.1 hypothetical protein [Evansella tamaricis]